MNKIMYKVLHQFFSSSKFEVKRPLLESYIIVGAALHVFEVNFGHILEFTLKSIHI